MSTLSSGFSNRVRGALKETLFHLGPLSGLFDEMLVPAFNESVQELVQGIEKGTIAISSPDRIKVVCNQIRASAIVAEEAANDMKNFSCKDTLLTKDQLAGVHLYTQETDSANGTDSLYAILNGALRNADRSQAKCMKKLIYLLLHALRKCPKSNASTLYRGVALDLRGEYSEGRTVTWHQASSCTSKVDLLSNPMFLGQSGPRAIFAITLAPNSRARRISDFSAMPNEDEVLLPPNTRLKVPSARPALRDQRRISLSLLRRAARQPRSACSIPGAGSVATELTTKKKIAQSYNQWCGWGAGGVAAASGGADHGTAYGAGAARSHRRLRRRRRGPVLSRACDFRRQNQNPSHARGPCLQLAFSPSRLRSRTS